MTQLTTDSAAGPSWTRRALLGALASVPLLSTIVQADHDDDHATSTCMLPALEESDWADGAVTITACPSSSASVTLQASGTLSRIPSRTQPADATETDAGTVTARETQFQREVELTAPPGESRRVWFRGTIEQLSQSDDTGRIVIEHIERPSRTDTSPDADDRLRDRDSTDDPDTRTTPDDTGGDASGSDASEPAADPPVEESPDPAPDPEPAPEAAPEPPESDASGTDSDGADVRFEADTLEADVNASEDG